LVFVALLQLGAFIVQACRLGQTIQVMRDTAERQLRAYVSVDTAQITGINSGDNPVADLVVKNFGQTPAYDLTEMGGIAMGVSFNTIPPPTGSHRMSRASLSAGAVTREFHPGPRPLTPEAIAALLAGTMTLWVYGEIHYRDAFKIERFTKYRFMIGGAVGIHGTNLAICEEGNEAN
jgi:hypothetical protein